MHKDKPQATATEPEALRTEFTPPERCRFYRNPRGFLALELDGKDYKRVQLTRAMPVTAPAQYITVADMENKEIAVLEDIAALADDARALVEEELGVRYFCPKLSSIQSVKEKMGSYYFDVMIGDFAKSITVSDISKNLKQLEGGRILLLDVDGNRFEIPDVYAIPRKNLRMLEPYLY
ncbi:MAG: DUF1854 domain-containing protein [Oscillospiraceae bacterium]|jgi:hypothetical protein|nr:DUF1854 domain-containing protein [Oscillospiraceae bacterium]